MKFIVVGILQAVLLTACLRENNPEMIDKTLRHTLSSAKIEVLKPKDSKNAKVVKLGQKLMFDKILSGRKDISCATCHNPMLHTGDGISISIGVGGKGFGASRVLGKGRNFNSRNAIDIFNRGISEFTTFNWDGSIYKTEKGLETPASDKLPPGLIGPLAAQHLFELASRQSMRGYVNDIRAVDGTPNELAGIEDVDFQKIWRSYMARLIGEPPGKGGIPEYMELFKAAYPDISIDKLGIQHLVNALAAWEISTWTYSRSPFDLYIEGDNDALNRSQKRGALVFYGKAKCYECHKGSITSDMDYHNIAAPQVGPGVGNESPIDLGRGRITKKSEDNFKFRTPPLRNVTLTGPWMHSGSYTTLIGVVKHHLDPVNSLKNYDPNQLDPRLRDMVRKEEIIQAGVLKNVDSTLSAPISLSDQELSDLMNFLDSLTDPDALDQNNQVPDKVPSGLPVYD